MEKVRVGVDDNVGVGVVEIVVERVTENVRVGVDDNVGVGVVEIVTDGVMEKLLVMEEVIDSVIEEDAKDDGVID